MNRQQLRELSRRYGLSIADINTHLAAGTLPAFNVQLSFAGALTTEEDTAGSGELVVSGVVTKYGELIPSHQMILEPGCAEFRQPADRVKLLRDHDMTQPIGYMTEVDGSGEVASFQVAPAEADQVRYDIDNKLRDGFSIGFSILEYEFDEAWVLHVHRAEVYETSLVAIPAVADAGVDTVSATIPAAPTTQLQPEGTTMDRQTLAAALAAGTITQEQHDTALAAFDAILPTQPETPAAELAAGPEVAAPAPAPAAALQVTETRSLRQVSRDLAAAANTGDMAQFQRQLALANTVLDDMAGSAYTQPTWEGEAWNYVDDTRPYVDAFGPVGEMRGIFGQGYKFTTEIVPDEYAGEGADIPTGKLETERVDYEGFAIAAGGAVERRLVDFANEGFWADLWPSLIRQYKLKSNVAIRTRTIAAATNKTTGTVTTGVAKLIKQVMNDVRPYGRVDRVFLGDDLFDQLGDLDSSALPVWLKTAEIVVDASEATGTIGRLVIAQDSSLNAKQIFAADSRFVKLQERTPFQLEALNIGKGLIDFSLFAYMRHDVQDTRAAVKRTVPAGS